MKHKNFTKLILFYISISILNLACEKVDLQEYFTDSRDGQIYKIITIGSQTWFAQNLNYDTEASRCYNDDKSEGDKYGRLYTYEDAIKSCPSGWHLPSDDEWKQLEMHLGISIEQVNLTGLRGTNEGAKLKSIERWDNEGNGNNSSGFTALPAGTYSPHLELYESIGRISYFWTSTIIISNHPYYRSLYDDESKINRWTINKICYMSVRCIKN